MPKINIKVTDNTESASLSSIPNTVYIPGPASVAVEPVLFTSASKFKSSMESGAYIPSMSSKLAYHLLNLGMYVLYEGCISEDSGETIEVGDSVKMTLGDSGWQFTINSIDYLVSNNEVSWYESEDSGTEPVLHTVSLDDGVANIADDIKITVDFIDGVVKYTKEVSVGEQPVINWERLADKSLYDIRFITLGQFINYAYKANALACASKRVDAVALIDTAETVVSEIREDIEGIVGGLDGSFGASFVPTWKGHIYDVDGSNSIVEHIPGSFAYLVAYARSVQSNPMWFAASGSFRGVLPELVDVDAKFSTADIEMLQARAKDEEVALDGIGDNVGIAINPIADIRPFGNIIWGNRTLRSNIADEMGVGLTKATSFLNCRVLATEVAKSVYNAARKYMFEQNSIVLWTNFKSEIIPLLDRMESGNGILGYTITKLPVDKKARLAARISLIPIEGVEDFDIEIELTDSISIIE